MVAVVSTQYRWTVVTPYTQNSTITRKGVGDTVPEWGERSTGIEMGRVPPIVDPSGMKICVDTFYAVATINPICRILVSSQ